MRRLFFSLARRTGLTFKRCPLCGSLSESGDLCADCAGELTARTGGFCPDCGAIFGTNDTEPTRCPECIHEPPPWDALYFHGCYEGALRRCIISYKFKNSLGRTRILSRLAVDAFRSRGRSMPDMVVPVPLHTRRLVWRGFNQSQGIAAALGKAFDTPLAKKALVRTRHTKPQTRLGMVQRRENIKDAFHADRSQVDGKTVLLVDDVYTTGATLRECTRTLRRAGAKKVDVLVLARTQDD